MFSGCKSRCSTHHGPPLAAVSGAAQPLRCRHRGEPAAVDASGVVAGRDLPGGGGVRIRVPAGCRPGAGGTVHGRRARVLPPAPFNRFGHGARLAGPDDTFVSINNDTMYSFAQLDLGAGAQLLEGPDARDRYLGYQFVDSRTSNFAYLGTRLAGLTGPLLGTACELTAVLLIWAPP